MSIAGANRQYCREYYQRNKEREKAKARARYAANRDRRRSQVRVSKLKRSYGITPEEYDALAVKQGNVCRICGAGTIGRRLAVDHDHATGKVRGLLCGDCNMGLGKFKDSPALLLQAVEYLGVRVYGTD